MDTTTTQTGERLESGNARSVTAATNTLNPVGHTDMPVGSDWGATMFVWGIWVLLMIGGLAYALTNCSFIPFSDDWMWVPVLTGDEHLSAAWLWEDVGEHRIPLAKLIVLALYTISGGDFRVGPTVNMLSLGMLALAMIWIAKKVRGYTSYTDAVFPLIFLTLNSARIFNCMGVSFIPSTILAGMMLLLIVRRGVQPSIVTSILAGCYTIALALIGPHGLALVPALSFWLIYLGVSHWKSREPGGRWKGMLVWGLAAAALLIVPLYFVNLRYRSDFAPSPSLWATLRTSLEFLTISFGCGAGGGLVEGYTPPIVGVGVVILSLVSGILLVVAFCKQPQERPRALGLFLFLGGMASLAWAMGLARAARGLGYGYQGHYAVLATPVLCCLYFIWDLYSSPHWRRLPQMGLFTLLCMFFLQNVAQLLAFAREYRQQMGVFEREVLAGTPPRIIASHDLTFVYDEAAGPEQTEYVADCLSSMRRAGIYPFTLLREDTTASIIEIALPVVPKEMNQLTWKDGVGVADGEDPFLAFSLKRPQFVSAIRVKIAYEKASSPPEFQLFWRRSDQNDFVEAERNHVLKLRSDPNEQTVTIPVNDTIDEFRIDPDIKPCVFKIPEITLLVPDAVTEDEQYQQLIHRVREAAGAAVPDGATVLVASGGDDDLLQLGGQRRGWHFPRDTDGNHDGNPADSADAIARLEELRAKGGQFVLFPEPYFWWLEEYKEFKRHLDDRYTRVHADKYCIIYQLGEPKAR